MHFTIILAIFYASTSYKMKVSISKNLLRDFTQGMVCHETYKDENNNWINPEEITTTNGVKYLKNNSTKNGRWTIRVNVQIQNTIDPENIISNYGADAVRLFILSDSPPEKDVQWSEEGITASYKFLQKLWTMNIKFLDEIKKNHENDDTQNLTKFTNKFIKKMTENLNSFSYNIIIANMHEMYSFLIKDLNTKYKTDTLKENYKKILISLTPIIPHFANECLEIINENRNLNWPSYDHSLIEDKEIQIVVQINGKKRGIVKVDRNIEEGKLYEQIMKEEKINKYLQEKEIKKKIYVKNRLINLII